MSDYDISILKKNIKDILSNRKITQHMLSENTGIPQARISKVLSDQTSDSFTIPQLAAISEFLGVSTDMLMYGQEKATEKQQKKRLSVKDVCTMLVQIDSVVRFCIDNNKFEENAIFGPYTSSFTVSPIETNHPTLYFLEWETEDEVAADIAISEFDFQYTQKFECTSINRFLEKYVELRKLRDSGIIEPEIFTDIVSSHISNLSEGCIIDRTDYDAVSAHYEIDEDENLPFY